MKLLTVEVDRQVIPGSFQHVLCYWVDDELDLASLLSREKNDASDAPALNSGDAPINMDIVNLAVSS